MSIPENHEDLQRRMQRAQDELEALQVFGQSIYSPRDIRPLYRLLVEYAARVMAVDASFIALHDAANGTLTTVFRYDKGVEEEVADQKPWRPSSNGPTYQVLTRGIAIRFDDFHRQLSEQFPQAVIRTFGDAQPSRSWLAVPLKIGSVVKGIINVQSYLEHAYTDRDERMLMTLGSMLAIAIEHARIVSGLERWREALSAPLIPVSSELIVLPLLGQLDSERVLMAQRLLLSTIERQRVHHVIIDLSGVTMLAGEAARDLERLARSVGLLGAGCTISGLKPELARSLALEQSRLLALPTVRDVGEGLAQLGGGAR